MITILTPTYNRGYILSQAYESLCSQTCKAFEWIIIDDGSTDNTQELVNSWCENVDFSIVYQKQDNGGKHRALNRGIALASTEYILILDSDDCLTEDAVEKIHQWTADIQGLEGFAGVSGLRGWKDREGSVIGSRLTSEYIDATNLERKKFHLTGDKAEVYKTEILRKYPFPEFEGENFLSEFAVWDSIAKDGYKLRWFNEIIYKGNYLSDGLTKNMNVQKILKNFQGYTYCARLYIQTRGGILALLHVGRYANVAKQAAKSNAQVRELLGVGGIKFFVAKCVYAIWRLLGRK